MLRDDTTEKRTRPAPPQGSILPSKKNKNLFSRLKETLGNLRLCIKYTLFDLEATKRENRMLKERLRSAGIDPDS